MPLHWAALALGLIATLLAWHLIRESQQRTASAEFNLRAERQLTEIRKRLMAYEQVLRGGAGLFAVAGAVKREQWREYVARLQIEDTFPGIQGLGFTKVVRPAERAAHVSALRAEGYPDYDIVPAGERDLYTSIVYLEPFSGRNLRAFGYDMFSEPVRRAAMERARDEGITATSGKVRLVQETFEQPQAGFLMYVPVYRDGRLPRTVAERRQWIEGYVYAPFRMNDFMLSGASAQSDDIGIRIFDGARPTPEALLFDNAGETAPHNAMPSPFARLAQIDTNGHTWTVQFHARPGFLVQRADHQSTLAALGGLLVTALLFAIAWTLSRTRDQALSIARDMTVNLRESEERLAGIIHAAKEAIITVDDEERIVLFNPTAEAVFKCSAAQAQGTPLGRFIPEPCRDGHTQHVRRFAATGVSEREMGGKHSTQRELIGLRADGEEFPLEASISQITQGGRKLFTVMLRDISERRQAEADARANHLRLTRSQEIAHFGYYEATHSAGESAPTPVWSAETFRILGLDPTGSPLSSNEYLQRCVHPEDRNALRDAVRGALASDRAVDCEYRIVRPDGSMRFVHDYAEYSRSAGARKRFFGVLHDITDRKRIELERLEAATKYRTLVEQLPAVTYLSDLDQNGSAVYVSPQIEPLLGFTPSEWCIDPELWSRQLHADDRERVLAALEQAIRDSVDLSLDYRLLAKNGNTVWIHDEARVVRNDKGVPMFFQGVILDVGTRKRAEQAVHEARDQLRRLAAHVQNAREIEVRRVTRQLNDDLGSTLAVLKMDLNAIDANDPTAGAFDLREPLATVDWAVRTTHRIVAELRAPSFDDVGLWGAIRLKAEEAARRGGFDCTLDLPAEIERVGEQWAAAVYRVAEESLDNVVRHARAQRVKVTARVSDQGLLLTIVDDGDGFTKRDLEQPGRHGVVGMRERVSALGGTFAIEHGASKKGTVVEVRVPLALSEPTPTHHAGQSSSFAQH